MTQQVHRTSIQFDATYNPEKLRRLVDDLRTTTTALNSVIAEYQALLARVQTLEAQVASLLPP